MNTDATKNSLDQMRCLMSSYPIHLMAIHIYACKARDLSDARTHAQRNVPRFKVNNTMKNVKGEREIRFSAYFSIWISPWRLQGFWFKDV